MELFKLNMNCPQPQTPEWARAEHMEISTPQTELWKYTKRAEK